MKHLSLLLALFLMLSCKEEPKIVDSYIIEGNAPGVYNGIRAYLKVRDERGRMMNKDTAMILDEKFVFTGKQDEPTLEFITIDGSDGFLPLVVENGNIKIDINKDSIHTSQVTGSPNNIAYQNYLTLEKQLTDKISSLNFEYRTADAEGKQAIYEKIIEANSAYSDLTLDYIKKNNDSYASLIVFNESMRKIKWPLENVETMYNSLSERLKTSTIGEKIEVFIIEQKEILEAQKATEIGGIAPNFSAPTPEGKMLALNDIKGKVTIIDFWASWCGPCRRENPNVVNVYNQFHDKGLEIISVSLDRGNQKERWLKAIKDDNLTWHHVSNLQFWQDPIAKMYNVRSIPATFILDEEGKIIAKNLRGPALGAKMEELLN